VGDSSEGSVWVAGKPAEPRVREWVSRLELEARALHTSHRYLARLSRIASFAAELKLVKSENCFALVGLERSPRKRRATPKL
jgi:hypothetical protein